MTVGTAIKMKMSLSIIEGIIMAGLSEGMAISHKAKISHKLLLDILGTTAFSCPLLLQKGKGIINVVIYI